MSSAPIWQPSPEKIDQTNLAYFQKLAAKKFEVSAEGYWDLYRWSIERPEEFWGFLAEFLKVKWHRQGTEVLLPAAEGLHPIMDAQWFPEYELNFAENLLPEPGEELRLISYVEGKEEPARWTGEELRRDVARCARFLLSRGVQKGDRVAAIVANTGEALIGMLAATSIGAVWTSCSPDFGPGAIVERFSQVKPKVLFATLAYQYNGRPCDCQTKIREALLELPSVELCVTIDPLSEERALQSFPVSVVSYSQSLAQHAGQGEKDLAIEFVSTSFDHPVYVMYSSGTTGVPKCIVHTAGGTLLQHKKELALHCNLGPGQRLLYYTTCGWMMWNWMASAFSTGASLVLYEGSPAYPSLSRLWEVLSKEGVQVFGTSPRFLASCQSEGLQPGKSLDLSKLETILSTGSPLLPEQFDWVYENVATNLHLASISGGTDIISCFMLGVPTLPIYRGEIQAPGLGMAVDCWDETGRSLRHEKGELVCTKPFPSAPLGFWGDDDRSRYRDAYFSHFAQFGVWHHGDFIEMRDSGGIVVHGRSDATLNPGGVRIGTAEIYREVELDQSIADSIVVDGHHDGNSVVILLVKMRQGLQLDQGRVLQLKAGIRKNLSPRHVPWGIFQVQDIPYTRSGKKLELAVKSALAGESIRNLSAMVNPECLGEYYEIGRQLTSVER